MWVPGEAEGSQGGAGRLQAWARDVRGLLYGLLRAAFQDFCAPSVHAELLSPWILEVTLKKTL